VKFSVNSPNNQQVADSNRNLNVKRSFLNTNKKPSASPHTHQSTVQYTLQCPIDNFEKTHLLTPDLSTWICQNDRTVHSLFFRRTWVISISLLFKISRHSQSDPWMPLYRRGNHQAPLSHGTDVHYWLKHKILPCKCYARKQPTCQNY
jgi:hypothetical protein